MGVKHQNLMKRTELAIQERWPKSICIPRITGFYYTRTGQGVRIGIDGEADLEVLMPFLGFLFITIYCEFKVDGDRPRKSQITFERNITERKGLYILVREPNEAIEAIDEYLQNIEKLVQNYF